MKRIFTFVLSALFAVFFTTVHAQQNVLIWKNGNVSIRPAANIDSLTSSLGSELLNIHISAATSVTTNTFGAAIEASFVDKVKSLSLTPELGVCFSTLNVNPTYADECVRLGSSVTNIDFTLYELDPGTTYYYRAYVKLGDDIFYSDVKSVLTFGEKPTKINYILINGHKFVDLGLPSGLLWARTNVGATYSFNDGNYFAWGEEEPKSCYNGSTYGGEISSKYNSSDGRMILGVEDDVATVNWGVPCRIPSSSEYSELEKECKWEWTSDYNGASGYTVTGPNGNSIFLPASGCIRESKISYHGSDGYYWSRSLYSSNTNSAYNLHFYIGRINPMNFGYRCSGLSIRPVAENK